MGGFAAKRRSYVATATLSPPGILPGGRLCDLIAYEDLRIKNMVKNHCLAKSINDASWYQFRVWIEYFAKVFEKVTVAVNPQ